MVLLAILVAWVPLFVLAALEGRLIGPTPPQSFLKDAAIYAKFFLALPVLICSTSVLPRAFETVFGYFLSSGLLEEDDKSKFRSFIDSAIQLRDSRVAGAVLIILAYLCALCALMITFATSVDTWRMSVLDGHPHLALAGWWLHLVSLPVYFLALGRFFYRIILWWGLAWRISKLNILARPAHPDGVGGLAFLNFLIPPFSLPCFAIASASAGTMADFVIWKGMQFQSYLPQVAAYIVGLTVLTVGPLAFFAMPLGRVKKQGILSHGALAQRQLTEWGSRWLGNETREGILSEPDASVTVDTGGVVARAYEMRIFPFELKGLLPVAAGSALPFLAVAALQIPLKDILLNVIKMLG
jgi:hypothetical protein